MSVTETAFRAIPPALKHRRPAFFPLTCAALQLERNSGVKRWRGHLFSMFVRFCHLMVQRKGAHFDRKFLSKVAAHLGCFLLVLAPFRRRFRVCDNRAFFHRVISSGDHTSLVPVNFPLFFCRAR